jgi:antitoxin (DNA-binding transcriptional repressor) of toxin-antitoxin stability system
METIEIEQALLKIREILELASSGVDIVITRERQPLVKLTSLTTPPGRPTLFGSDRSILSLCEDFDEPLTEFLDDP